MIRTLVLAAVVASLASCAAIGSWFGGGKQKEYKELVAKAENEIKLAAQTGFLWGNTEKFLNDAKEAREKGDKDTAIKLAKKALDEAQLAQKQAKDNAKPKTIFE